MFALVKTWVVIPLLTIIGKLNNNNLNHKYLCLLGHGSGPVMNSVICPRDDDIWDLAINFEHFHNSPHVFMFNYYFRQSIFNICLSLVTSYHVVEHTASRCHPEACKNMLSKLSLRMGEECTAGSHQIPAKSSVLLKAKSHEKNTRKKEWNLWHQEKKWVI